MNKRQRARMPEEGHAPTAKLQAHYFCTRGRRLIAANIREYPDRIVSPHLAAFTVEHWC